SVMPSSTPTNNPILAGSQLGIGAEVSEGDAQTERGYRLKGVYTGAQTEDVLSQSSKERFKRQKSGKRVIMQNQKNGRGGINRFNSGIFRIKQDGQRVIDFKGRGNRKRNFDSIQTNANQEDKFSS
ncbi:MAG: hypothetical protein EZS28_032836, partial [Streblomastix strix]